MNVALFLSSYFALFVALAVRFDTLSLRIACGSIAAMGLAATFYIVGFQRKRSSHIIRLTAVDDRGPEVSGYVATYVLPLVVIGEPHWNDIVAYSIVLAAIGVIYVRSRMIQLNPTLYVLGYVVLEVATEDGFRGYLVTRQEPTVDDCLEVHRRDNVLFDGGVPLEEIEGETRCE